MSATGWKVKDIKSDNKLVRGTQHQKKTVEKAITGRQKFIVFNDLVSLKNGLDLANSNYNYNREQLHEVYSQIWKDTHLQSQWNTRKLRTINRDFSITDSAGNENEALTDLLKDVSWFLDFQSFSFDALMWGFSLVQFGVWKNGQFNAFELNGLIKDSVYEIDRDHVKPEYGIITETPSQNTGIRFDDPQYWVTFIGKSHNLGMLEKLAPLILIKNNMILNWSEWAEVFGMDMRIAKTDNTGEARAQLQTSLENLGSNGIGVFSMDDMIEFVGTNRSDAYEVYEKGIRYIDEQISKIIYGQDVVSNNTGQVVGEIGENVAKLYGNADARFMKGVINAILLPFMTRIGAANFEGYKLEWKESEELTLLERAEIDLKIAQMGKAHSDDYINETYGTDVEDNNEGGAIEDVANKIKNMYK